MRHAQRVQKFFEALDVEVVIDTTIEDLIVTEDEFRRARLNSDAIDALSEGYTDLLIWHELCHYLARVTKKEMIRRQR